jgi:hypothetical protein
VPALRLGGAGARRVHPIIGRLEKRTLCVALDKALEDVDANSQDGQEIGSIMGTLDKLCER